MPKNNIKCKKCGSNDVLEYKPNNYICSDCDCVFRHEDANRSDVLLALQFCETGCGNPVIFKCVRCGRMVCGAHGKKQKEYLSSKFSKLWWLKDIEASELQSAWCTNCIERLEPSEISDMLCHLLVFSEGKGNLDSLLMTIDSIGEQTSLEKIAGCFRISNVSDRICAAATLGKFSNIASGMLLVAALDDSNQKVRETAAKSLAKLQFREGVPVIIDCYKKKKISEISAMQILEKFEDKEALRVANELRKEKERDVSSLIKAYKQTIIGVKMGRKYNPANYTDKEIQEIRDDLVALGGNKVINALVKIMKKDRCGLSAEMLLKIGNEKGVREVRGLWKKGYFYEGDQNEFDKYFRSK